MIKKIAFLFLFSSIHVFCQSTKTVQICLQITNSTEKNIHFSLFQESTLLLSQTQSVQEPCFFLKTNTKGHYQLLIESECCGIIKQEWRVDTMAVTSLFRLKLSEKVIALHEIKVQAGSRLVQKGDTLFIKTEDIPTRPHADATAIFDKIAGLQIGIGGNVSILGQAVQEITVDGKRIFGGVPILALNNIRSDMIQQMEFIEKTLANGQKINQLNLKLKANRKNGAYGDVVGGLGKSENYLLGGNYNKIKGSSFTNAFFTSNSINEQGIATKDIQRITENSFLNSLNRTSSTIGLYDNQNTSITPDVQSLNADFLGKNKSSNAGGNFTYTGKKSNFDAFVFLGKTSQELNTTEARKTFLNENTQFLQDFQNQNNASKGLNLAINDKTQVNEKITLQISNHLKINQKNSLLSDTTLSYLNQNPTNYFVFANRNNESKDWINNLQTSLTRKGKEKGSMTSLYFNFYHQSTTENNRFQNTYSILENQQNGSISKDIDLNKIQGQLVQSIPLSKHALIEGKISHEAENVSFFQKTLATNVAVSSPFTSGQLSIKNVQQEYGAYLLYQYPKWLFIAGLSYLHWESQRANESLIASIDNPQKQLFLIPVLKFTYRFSLKSSTSLQYHSRFVLPDWRNLVNIPDSSSLVNLTVGNLALLPYFDRSLDLNTTQSLGNGFQVNYSLNYHWYQGYVMNESTLNNQTNLVSNSFLNSANPVQSIGFNFFAFKVGIKSRLSWAMFGGFNHLSSYQQIKNSELNISSTSPLVTDIFFTSQSFKWNVSDKLSFQADWRMQGNYVANSFNWSNSIFVKSDFDLGKKWFINTSLRLFVNKNIPNRNNFQPFLNAQIDRYLLKNNGICLSLVIKNAFNYSYETSLSQSANQQTILTNSYLPRVFLLKLTLYPESWK